MSTNAILFSWNRPLPGREPMSAQHFQDFTQYLQGLKAQGAIESFEPVLLQPYGGELNGFFYIRGESARLDAVVASPEWVQHQIRGTLHLDRSGTLRAVTGPLVAERMAMWAQTIPR